MGKVTISVTVLTVGSLLSTVEIAVAGVPDPAFAPLCMTTPVLGVVVAPHGGLGGVHGVVINPGGGIHGTIINPGGGFHGTVINPGGGVHGTVINPGGHINGVVVNPGG
jgi:hypothetical protein